LAFRRRTLNEKTDIEFSQKRWYRQQKPGETIVLSLVTCPLGYDAQTENNPLLALAARAATGRGQRINVKTTETGGKTRSPPHFLGPAKRRATETSPMF